MINKYLYFPPFSINRGRLHKTFLADGYYSRFDTCSNAAVILRFHYVYALGPENDGRRPYPHPRECHCKDLPVLIFQEGIMNIIGLENHEQGQVVYDFLKNFFAQKRLEISGD